MVHTWLEDHLSRNKYTWLVTGAAGFIGSHLLEYLLNNQQNVVGLDNFVTGKHSNLDEVRNSVGDRWQNFSLIKGDVRDLDQCLNAASGVDIILHQAALGSVPQSINDPLETNSVNLTGFVNMLVAARDKGIKKFVYASSCAVYGDNHHLPLAENEKPRPLSPYAASKACNEIYADAFQRSYGINAIGLRYFNVFGERQDPLGAYAAVIPKWISSAIHAKPLQINGDGTNTRDFIYVADVVKANIAAALIENASPGLVLNVASGEEISLNDLSSLILNKVTRVLGKRKTTDTVFREERFGDIKFSCASTTLSHRILQIAPNNTSTGLDKTLQWYVKSYSKDNMSHADI